MSRSMLMWLMAAIAAGCGDAPDAPLVAPATTPASTGPASAPAATRPARAEVPSVMIIDGQRVAFPPARLRTEKAGDGLLVTLFSADVSDVDRDANSFYFEMTLNSPAGNWLDAGEWRYLPTGDEEEEPIHHVTLDGGATHLLPVDVEVGFERRDDGEYIARVTGQFSRRRSEAGDAGAAAKVVTVESELTAVVEED